MSEAARERKMVFELDRFVVEAIIGEIFYKTDDVGKEEFDPADEIGDLAAELAYVAAHRREETARVEECALSIFKINAAENFNEKTSYTATTLRSKERLFSLVIFYILYDTSFR